MGDCRSHFCGPRPSHCDSFLVVVMDKMMFNQKDLARRIKKLRRGLGLSRKALAQKIGVHTQTIYWLESRGGTPSLTNACRLARAFEISLDDLVWPEARPKSKID